MPDAAPQPQRRLNRLSTARFYALLARHDLTSARLIGEIRLRHASDALTSVTRWHETITDIALAHGFTDSARFSHAFKERFGLPPSAWRARQAD